MKKYVIKCQPRVGSSYLCDLLKSTKRAGEPSEFFNEDLEDSFKKRFKCINTNVEEYKHQCIKHTKTENDVFGIKLICNKRQLKWFDISGLQPTHWIWLYREDKLLQAVSIYRAWYLQKWGQHDEDYDVPFDLHTIDWFVQDIKRRDEYLQNFFRSKPHIKISYESDLCNSPEQTVNYILDYLDVSTECLPVIKSKIKKNPTRNALLLKSKYIIHKGFR